MRATDLVSTNVSMQRLYDDENMVSNLMSCVVIRTFIQTRIQTRVIVAYFLRSSESMNLESSSVRLKRAVD